MGKRQAVDLLPAVTRNKAYERKKKHVAKRRMEELRRENPREAARMEKAALKKLKAAKKAATAAGKLKKSEAAVALATETKRTKKRERRPKTVVANVPTGRETFAKSKARELVMEKKNKKNKKKDKAKDPVSSGDATVAETKTSSHKQRRAASNGKDSVDVMDKDTEQQRGGPPDAGANLVELDQMLLERTIRGGGGAASGGNGDSLYGPSTDVRCDPSLYPSDVAFYHDYAEKKQADAVSEDALLKHAHDYFRKVGRREKELNRAAASFLRKMKEVNHRGGDRDGFRYVLPTNVKDVVKMMKEKEHYERQVGPSGGDGGAAQADAWVDSDALRSTFGGEEVDHGSDKPMRRKKKRSRTSTDFYQWQVTKRWTKNAESFLNSGRAHKSLFEAKKRQRSIRKL